MSLWRRRYRVAKNVITLTMTTSSTNTMVVLRISGPFTVLFNIFLIMRPLCVVKPVLIATEKVLPFFVSNTFDPS